MGSSRAGGAIACEWGATEWVWSEHWHITAPLNHNPCPPPATVVLFFLFWNWKYCNLIKTWPPPWGSYNWVGLEKFSSLLEFPHFWDLKTFPILLWDEIKTSFRFFRKWEMLWEVGAREGGQDAHFFLGKKTQAVTLINLWLYHTGWSNCSEHSSSYAQTHHPKINLGTWQNVLWQTIRRNKRPRETELLFACPYTSFFTCLFDSVYQCEWGIMIWLHMIKKDIFLVRILRKLDLIDRKHWHCLKV